MNRLALTLAILTLPGSGIAQTTYENYTFTTLAGLAEAGLGWYDGAGSSARFNYPYGVAVDLAGNAYVADSYNHTIRKITPAGAVSTLAGLAGTPGSADGIGSAARFNTPTALAVDPGGNVYVADTLNNTIRKITPTGVVTTMAGTPGTSGSADGTARAARFGQPFGIAVDSATNLYVSDTSNQTIRRITPDQVVTTLAGTAAVAGTNNGTGSAARFTSPCGICADSAGDLYVADYGNCSIRKITPSGVVLTLAGNGNSGSADGTGSAAQFKFPIGVAVDGGGVLYVADSDNATIRKLTQDGVVTTLAGKAGSTGTAVGIGTGARFNFPTSVAVDGTGNLYVSDCVNCAIRKISAGAVVSTLAGVPDASGSDDGTGSSARFNDPCGLALDRGGNLYVADLANNTIREVTPDGVVTTLAGTAGTSGTNDGTGTAALFLNPAAVAVDDATNLYVADTYNHTIRKVTPAGVVATLAGMPATLGTNDGSGNSARFNTPMGLAANGDGTLYVADTWNHTIRKVTPAGEVTTIAGRAGVPGATDAKTGNAALFYYPKGLALDSNTNLYVADSGNYTIRKITPAGAVTTFAGTAQIAGNADGTGTSARFTSPFGVAVDAAGNVYVSDSSSNVIRKITPKAVVHTVAGSPGVSGSADGTGAAAFFNYPEGIAVDPQGYLYVANAQNHAIRKGYPALPDQPWVRPASGAPGIIRQFGISNLTTIAWSWRTVRLPTPSLAQLSAATTTTPSLTPDVPDTYVVRFEGQDSQGHWAIGNVSSTAVLNPALVVTYTTTSGTITGYAGSGGNVTIPSTLNGLPVTSIGADAFAGSDGLTTVTIPTNVTSIGDGAFADCYSLTAITIQTPSSFYSSVAGVLFNKAQTTLIQYPEAKSGSSYTIPAGVTGIGNGAFADCASLTSITIPNSVATIGDSAFNGCSSLRSVTIPPGVTSIGDGVFAGCARLTSVTIPTSVTNIGDDAFDYCTNLTSVMIPNGVTAIGDSVFYDCYSLTSVTIPNSVNSIEGSAFDGCISLTSVTIPTSVTDIGDGAFAGCARLTSVTIPNSVTNIGDGTFAGCIRLTNVTIPNTVISIGNGAFASCTNLTTIPIPKSVTNIGDGAFVYCSSLTAITVDSLNPVYCDLDGVLFNKSQTTLIRYPTAKPGTSYTVPASVTNIGTSAFEGCYGLKVVYFQGNAPTFGLGVFDNDDITTVYYLPQTTGWGPTIAGRPAVLWNAHAQTSGGNFGVRTNQFEFTITGASNLVIVVEACTNLVNPAWSPLTTNTLTGGSSYFSDPRWTNYPGRFYRLRWP